MRISEQTRNDFVVHSDSSIAADVQRGAEAFVNANFDSIAEEYVKRTGFESRRDGTHPAVVNVAVTSVGLSSLKLAVSVGVKSAFNDELSGKWPIKVIPVDVSGDSFKQLEALAKSEPAEPRVVRSQRGTGAASSDTVEPLRNCWLPQSEYSRRR